MDINEVAVKIGYYAEQLEEHLEENEEELKTVFGKDWNYLQKFSIVLQQNASKLGQDSTIAAVTLGENISSLNSVFNKYKISSNIIDRMKGVIGVD
jgi:DNA-directed RNA polymerase subunit F